MISRAFIEVRKRIYLSFANTLKLKMSSSESNLSFSSSSSESSDENEVLELLNMIPRPKVYRDRNEALEMYNEAEFKARFRFTKEAVLTMLDLFEINQDLKPTNRNFPISPLNKLLVTLRFYATGSFQQVLGDHVNLDKSTVSRIIPFITEKIASKAPQFIHMPRTGEEIVRVCQDFYAINGFPNIVGALNCSHIRISSPGGDNAEHFQNRKGYFSLNVQVVCDAHLRILDIVARWPGSVHDSTIFNSCPLRARFEMNEFSGKWLLGDNGYSCRNYLLTPLLNPGTPAEERYNNSHIRTRNVVERTFGVWKRRFPCLSQGMRLKTSMVVDIIVATDVLHNLSLQDINSDLSDPIPEEDNIANIVENVQENHNRNTSARQTLIQTVFERRS